jgi:ParB-like chromosome segregation protein Spo0J
MANDIIWVDIEKVKINDKNPRFIKDKKFEKLVKSIKAFPEMLTKRPIICYTDNDKYIVLGGNMRLRALQEINAKEVPILLADEWTEKQRNEFLIKDNINFGEWDYDILSTNFEIEDLEDFGLDAFNIERETRNIIGNNYDAIKEINNKDYIILYLEKKHLAKIESLKNIFNVDDKEAVILKIIEDYDK